LFLVAHYDIDQQNFHDATLADGTPIPVAAFQDMACQGKVVPAIFDTRGRPLWVGMSKRLATPAQRMALIARDRGCVGCGADPAWCQAHHVIPWEAGGPTDIDNMCLLCSRCHHQIHDDGWIIRQTPDGKHTMQPPPKEHRTSLPIKPSNSRQRRGCRKPVSPATNTVKTGQRPRNKPPP
jgi:5-methylcytosine-specific restriction protein A